MQKEAKCICIQTLSHQKNNSIMKKNLFPSQNPKIKKINEELLRDIPDLPTLTPTETLWQPPEPIPAEIEARMPGEKEIAHLLTLLKKDGILDTPDQRDRIRSFANLRRIEEYTEWKKPPVE